MTGIGLILLQFGGNQSALNPRGPGATGIADLAWYMIFVLGAAYLITMALVLWAFVQGRRGSRLGEAGSRNVVIAWGLAVPLIVLTSILFYTVGVSPILSVVPHKDALTIHVTGKQWWWEVRYLKGSDVIAETANEIHVPARTPVKVKLNSNDVIHSFWVPNLHGKMDLIPSRTNETWFRADAEGVWRGECAEFCGQQHAHMAFEVVAEPSHKFYEWLEWQRNPAAQPTSDLERKGQDVFVKGPCAMCHKVRGTLAGGSAGPDLTHFASRRTLAAATLPNNRGNLGGWIVNAQGVKPGSRMPRINLPAADLEALLAYMETLR